MSSKEHTSDLPPVQKKPDNNPVVTGRRKPSIVVRLVISTVMLIALAGLAFGVYLFGMLMFAFSGDSATAGSWPDWIEPYMFIGWWFALGFSCFVPPAVVLIWPRLRYAIPAILFAIIFPVAWYLIGWITFIVCISNPPKPEPRGPITYIATQQFANPFSFSKADAEKHGLKPIEFSLSYPDTVRATIPRPGDANEFLLELVASQDGVPLELMRFYPAEDVGPSVDSHHLETLFEKYKTKFPNSKKAEIKHGLWNNQLGRQIEMVISENDPAGKTVEVKLMAMILEPPNEQKHSLVLEIRTYPGSKAKDFWSFDDFGMPDQVWSSFQFSAQE